MIQRVPGVFVGLCGLMLALVGCSSLSGSDGPSEPAQSSLILRQPEVVEKELFKIISAYYCEHRSWPKAFGDIEEFEEARGRATAILADFKNANLSSQRAIILTVVYENALGVERKVSFIAPPRCDEDENADHVSIAAGRIRFALPEDFELLSGKEIKKKWRAPPYPDVVWRGDDDLLIAVRFGDVVVDKEGIRALESDIAAAYESSVPGLGWIRREETGAGGGAAVIHEFESDSTRGRLATRVLSTVFDGKLMAVTVIGLASDRARVDEVATTIDDTLSIN